MIYANQIKDGTVNVKIQKRDGSNLSRNQFIDELASIFIACLQDEDLQDEEEIDQVVDLLNEAIEKARSHVLESRNNYFDQRAEEGKR